MLLPTCGMKHSVDQTDVTYGDLFELRVQVSQKLTFGQWGVVRNSKQGVIWKSDIHSLDG